MRDTGLTFPINLEDIEKKFFEMSNGKKLDKPSYDLDHAANIVGHAAVKYFDLRQNRINDYWFDYNKILDPQGDTAVYLLYGYARICSIIKKTGIDINTINMNELKANHPQERALLIELLKFPDVIDQTVEDLMINRLCDFLYKVAGQFQGGFYKECPVMGSKEQRSRILLCLLTKQVLETGFDLLGFKGLEQI